MQPLKYLTFAAGDVEFAVCRAVTTGGCGLTSGACNTTTGASLGVANDAPQLTQGALSLTYTGGEACGAGFRNTVILFSCDPNIMPGAPSSLIAGLFLSTYCTTLPLFSTLPFTPLAYPFHPQILTSLLTQAEDSHPIRIETNGMPANVYEL